MIVTPGPGAYVAPSAFGIYVGERALLENKSQRQHSSVPKMRTTPGGTAQSSSGFDDIKKLINNTY